MSSPHLNEKKLLVVSRISSTSNKMASHATNVQASDDKIHNI